MQYVAEIELSVVGRWLRERMNGTVELAEHLAAMEQDHNNACKSVDWEFTADQARPKLTRAAPVSDFNLREPEGDVLFPLLLLP